MKNSRAIRSSRYKSLASYIEAQARHETGNFTSNLFLNANNLFGMTVPKKRYHLGFPSGILSEDKTEYLGFKNSDESIADLLLWFDNQNFPTSVNGADEYARELKARGYYTAPYSEYLNGLNRFL